MKVSNAIIKCLEKENVKTIFGYPGGAVLPIYESLRQSKINHILTRHEQGAAHAACGYALASDTVGVCIATSGPGATNLITGIANAYMDSIPLVAITGQVSTKIIGTDSFQEADIIGATEPFTKHNYLIKDEKNLVKTIKEAFHIANSGRKGPVVIDIPINIQDKEINFDYTTPVEIKGYQPTYKGHKLQIKKAYEKIKEAKKPLICVGGGVVLSKAHKNIRNFVEKTKIPAVSTLKGKGSLIETSDYYFGMIGSHGTNCSNTFVEESDLLIIIGMSVSNRSTAEFNIQGKNIIHIDIDPAEVGKNIPSNIPIIGDAKHIIDELNSFDYDLAIHPWVEKVRQLKAEHSNYLGQCDFVDSILSEFSKKSSDDCIFLADVGNNQIWAAHNCQMTNNEKFITSGGLGTMGFCLPASIGAKISQPTKEVYAITGDGGFQMSINELITISENELDIKIILLDNHKLGMIEGLQEKYYGETFSADFIRNPNFEKLCEANYINYLEIKSSEDIDKAIQSKGPILLHVKV